MGAETAVAAGVALGSAVIGRSQASHAERRAHEFANEQRAHQESQATLYKADQAKAAQREKVAQQRVNQQTARSNRRRVRGGLFGDPQPTQGITRATLG